MKTHHDSFLALARIALLCSFVLGAAASSGAADEPKEVLRVFAGAPAHSASGESGRSELRRLGTPQSPNGQYEASTCRDLQGEV